MLQLRTFGGLSLRLDGTAITGTVTQRRRLALLALLAVMGEEGMSRDKLLAYLWPEKDAESSRHILNQLLYAYRRLAGCEGLFLGRKTLRLNSAMIETDLEVFEAGFASGNLERAVSTYRGPFLDGFFLPEAVPFEDWVTGQRDRYARRVAEALEQLARRALEQNDLDAEVRWRHLAVELSPLSGTTVLALAETLSRRGDRPAALRVLRVHRERVRKELQAEVDPVMVSLEQRLAG